MLQEIKGGFNIIKIQVSDFEGISWVSNTWNGKNKYDTRVHDKVMCS
jgi:hypothetical protein